MRYGHRYTQLKNIEPKQWKALSEMVGKVFVWLQSPEIPSFYRENPISICEASGHVVLTEPHQLFSTEKRIKRLAFNGDDSRGQAHDPFCLYQKVADEKNTYTFQTGGKPYDWFVMAVLILMDNLCPRTFEIVTDGDAETWMPVLKWLNQRTGDEYVLPMCVMSEVFAKAG